MRVIGLDSRCVTFSETHKNVSSPVKLKTLWAILFESLPMVWAACTIFSQMRNLQISVLSSGSKILVCEMSRRDDKTSSCNHDMDLVIGGITLILIGTFGEQ